MGVADDSDEGALDVGARTLILFSVRWSVMQDIANLFESQLAVPKTAALADYTI